MAAPKTPAIPSQRSCTTPGGGRCLRDSKYRKLQAKRVIHVIRRENRSNERYENPPLLKIVGHFSGQIGAKIADLFAVPPNHSDRVEIHRVVGFRFKIHLLVTAAVLNGFLPAAAVPVFVSRSGHARAEMRKSLCYR